VELDDIKTADSGVLRVDESARGRIPQSYSQPLVNPDEDEMHVVRVDERHRKPHDTAFKQQVRRSPRPLPRPLLSRASRVDAQALPAWEPRLTYRWAIGTYLSTAVLFVIIGAVLLDSSERTVEVAVRYDSAPSCAAVEGTGATCAVELPIPEDMSPPVFFYYRLVHFYQNHRRFVRSRAEGQLNGQTGLFRDCRPLVRYRDSPEGNITALFDKVRARPAPPARSPHARSRSCSTRAGWSPTPSSAIGSTRRV
jgi:hypothetical protein